MKRFIASVLAACIVGGAMPVSVNYAAEQTASANTKDRDRITVGNFTYDLYADDHAAIVFFTDKEAETASVPREIAGSPITEIDGRESMALYGFGTFGGGKLKTIIVPGSVKRIGNYAFANCPELESVTILDPKCEIGDNAISSGTDENFSGTIYGYANSTAQVYAERNGFDFAAVDVTAYPLKGDANLDSQVNIADAVLVMQVATNPDKYAQGKSDLSIKPQGEVNADVDGKKGLSDSDALVVQKFKLGLIDKL